MRTVLILYNALCSVWAFFSGVLFWNYEKVQICPKPYLNVAIRLQIVIIKTQNIDVTVEVLYKIEIGHWYYKWTSKPQDTAFGTPLQAIPWCNVHHR